jgi:predicted nucleic acid-binding protein
MTIGEPPLVVVDASVLLDALTTPGKEGARARDSVDNHRLAAPEHLLVETFNGIRGRMIGGKLKSPLAERALHRLAHVYVELVPARLLLDRMWELRDNVSGYDAAYVATAEYLEVPLLTSDRRLAAAPGLRCEVRVP